ncbi:MAG: glycosyltransferase family 39 protein [Bacteroidales bacterium]
MALTLIVACGLLLRLFVAWDLYLHPWDERYHALVAKHMRLQPFFPTLYEDPLLPFDFRDWTRNHIWLHKQPLPLWTMALSLSVFGVNELAVRLPSILLTTGGIVLMFEIGRYFFSSRVGLLSAFFYSVHGLIIELAAGRVATDHMDVFLLFFIQLSVYFAIRFFRTGKPVFNLLCGVGIGLGVLSKWLPALLVMPLWWGVALSEGKRVNGKTLLQFAAMAGMTLLVALPWQVYVFHRFPEEARWEYGYNIKHIGEALEGHGKSWYFHFARMGALYGLFTIPALLWFGYKTLKRPRAFGRWTLLAWIAIPYVVFSLAQTKMQAYTLVAAPALFLVPALFWETIRVFRRRFRWRIVPLLVLILLPAFPVQYSLERVKPFSSRVRNPDWAQELRELGRRLEHPEKTVVFQADHPIETMFYTDCQAYAGVPDPVALQRIRELGYRVLIRDSLTNDPRARDFAMDGRSIELPAFGIRYTEPEGLPVPY